MTLWKHNSKIKHLKFEKANLEFAYLIRKEAWNTLILVIFTSLTHLTFYQQKRKVGPSRSNDSDMGST